MRILFLADKIPWFGRYSGYEWLPRYVAESSGHRCDTTLAGDGFAARTIGRLSQKMLGLRNDDPLRAAAELRFSAKAVVRPSSVAHILYLDFHVAKWGAAGGRRRRIGTLHLPPSRWMPGTRRYLPLLDHIILLYERDIPKVAALLSPERVHFIRYGLDTAFFHPPVTRPDNQSGFRILFAGHWLRNTGMLARVVDRLLARKAPVTFDMLVPTKRRTAPGLDRLRTYPTVRWHENLSDTELVQLYQSSYLLLIPFNDGGANTAVIEALACGLPVVTTDSGGTRSYGAGSIFPVVKNNDDDGMVELIFGYLNDLAWRDEIGAKCRRFAEEKLSWAVTAREHIALYERLYG
jgi:glycosyltransferase involved in cell wall biosynthesis